MADSTTPNYGWAYPTVGADSDTWGTTLNNMAIAIDASLKTVSDAKADLASPTFTGTAVFDALSASGTATFADSGTWGSGGIAGLTKLGIGMTASNILDIMQTQDAASSVVINNASTGTSAASLFNAYNGTHQAQFGIKGTGFTTSGVLAANRMFLTATSGISLQSAGDIRFATSGTAEVARLGTDGSFLLGSTTNAGAGSIGATGNITAYYSDDRLKTRLGGIEDPIGKVMALKGFYYEANETAQALGYTAKREVGLSAQDVNSVLPEVVAPAPIDAKYMTLHYERIIPLLVEAIKAQQSQIAALQVSR